MRRGVVGHEDVLLLNVKQERSRSGKITHPFEVPVCETDTVEIRKALGYSVQLSPHVSERVMEKVDPRTSSSLLVSLLRM